MQSLTDNGNTAQFLASIAILAPNNFIKFYNKLIASSPYLSDTVLIAFMTHPINKPAQKKAVVLANSPLPYSIRPYIDQMNVNQNFKNQMWAAQTGSSNAKVQLENYISWLGNRRQQEINALAVNSNNDTLGFERDSLINYLNNSVILNDRIIRYNLLIDKSDYNNATAELSEIISLTSDLSIEKQQEYIEFAEVAGIFIYASQLPDSSADSLILANQTYLETIAGAEFHLAQSDAKTLLEKAGIAQQYLAYLPDGITTKSFRIPDINNSETSELCEILTVYPNPSNGNMLVKYDLGNEESIVEIMLTATDGKIINSYKLSATNGEIQINCNTCITGNYILTLYVDGEKQCSKELNIKK